MREYAYEFDPAIPRGQVVFRVRNAGTEDHEIDISALPEDLLPLNEQLHSEESVAVRTVARFPARPPGSTGTFAVFLEPGRYGVMCLLRDQDKELKARKGMNAEFRVA